MKKYIFSSIIVCAMIGALFSLLFGSYSPFVKAKRALTSLRAFSSLQSVENFENNFNKSLQFYSPIGNTELIKFLSHDIANALIDKPEESVARALVAYIEPYISQYDVRHLLTMGRIYHIVWRNYGKKNKDFEKAEKYYKEALKIGPKLPLPLYNLLSLYSQQGNEQKMYELKNSILLLWPTAALPPLRN